MESKYADWELSCLLPEAFDELGIWICSDNKVRLSHIAIQWLKDRFWEDWRKYQKEHVRIAWDWESIRLYLKDKEYEVEIRKYSFYDYCPLIRYKGEIIKEFKDIQTYEEARRESIIYCLNQIKCGTIE